MGLWTRAFAALYDRALAGSEEAGLSAMRGVLLAEARGRTLEIGAGTGLNLPHYGPAVGELVLAEPHEPMARRLRARAAELGSAARIVDASAERLPFDDGSFDTVVVTLVLCTVDDVPAALAEIRRVLAPGGRLLFLEHVRSNDPSLARWQDRLERPWRAIGDGCRCNRDTLAAITAAGFSIDEIARGRLPKAAKLVRPMIRGAATPA